MTLLKYIVLILIFILICIAGYVAWQNRASEKVVTSFITVALAGAAATLAMTLFAVETGTFDISFYKTYIFEKISKMPISANFPSPIDAFSGREMSMDTIVSIQEAIQRDPSLAVIEEDSSDAKRTDDGAKLYQDILYHQIITTMCRYCGLSSRAKRNVDVFGSTVLGVQKSTMIPTRKISWHEIKMWNPNNIFLNSPNVMGYALTVPRKSIVTGDNHSIQIRDNFISLTITITKAGGSMGVGSLKRLFQITSGESMKYWTQNYEIEINAKFSAIRSGHPLMNEYKDWVNAIIDELSYQFNSQLHWEKTKEQFILYRNLPKETTEGAFKSQETYFQWLKEQIEIHKKNANSQEVENKSIK